jgi:hypothetical protein
MKEPLYRRLTMSRSVPESETRPSGNFLETLSDGAWRGATYVLAPYGFTGIAKTGYTVQQERGALNAVFWPKKRDPRNPNGRR